MTQITVRIDRENTTPLFATLDLPVTKSRAYALFFHNFFSLGSKAHESIVGALNRHGIGVLHFDIAASESNEPRTINDVQLLCDYMSTHYFTPQLCIGHSLGTLALLAVTQGLPDIRALVAIGTPSDISSFGVSTTGGDMFSTSTTTIRLPAAITLDKELFTVIQRMDIPATITSLAKPVLLLHAPEDSVCPYWHVNKLFDAAHQPKSLISLHNSDHALTDSTALEYAATMISSWVTHHLFANSSSVEESGSRDSVVVCETGTLPYQQAIRIGKHHFFADETTERDGNDSGPAPTMQLLAALGSSTSIAIRKYALAKCWSLDHIQIELKHVFNTHSANSMIPSSEYILKEITLSGSLDGVQRSALVDVGNNCLVHKALGKKVITRLKPHAALEVTSA